MNHESIQHYINEILKTCTMADARKTIKLAEKWLVMV